jgi:NADH dehydrogenase [ubiquinone] 1 alpha subcomplex assembly factor 1
MILFDFVPAGSTADWAPINDGVMGGRSQSTMRHDPAGYACFEGVVSFENNGGFASVRSRPLSLGDVAPQFEPVGLRADGAFDGINYQAAFESPAGIWVTLTLPLAAFSPSFRGRPVPEAPPLDPALVKQIGLMIADRQGGPFALAVKRISTLGSAGEAAPTC